ncbi:MAG: glycerophosphodiester phosphodiesterase [Bacteroidales bacterium]|nr:glycerophosphodiester phosphodiesterase [Bacteroidales bacterium]
MKAIHKIMTIMLAGMMMFPIAADAQKKAGIVAHRGFWNCEEAGYAKNSLAALRCAQEAGFWGSEFDVNMTSDSVLIVYHDSDVEGKRIEKHPYETFKDFKIKNGETIPTIDQYLEQGKKYPETMLVYELKSHSCDAVEDRFVELTIEKLQEHGLLDPQRVMFISFSLHMCEVLAQKLPGFTVQFLGSSKSPDELAERNINGVDYNHAVYSIHKKWYRQARKNDMSVNAWTVNNEKEMKKMFRMGVDQLTTDNPLTAREVLEKIGYTELR